MKDYPFFKANKLKCRCGQCDGGEMDDAFMRAVVDIREEVDTPLIVTSAYRCPAYNARISSTGENGPHTTGRAIDIQASGELAVMLVRAFILTPEAGGLGLMQHGPHKKRFIHLDDLDDLDYADDHPRPRVWTYPG